MITINLLPKKICTECKETKPSCLFQRIVRECGRFGEKTLSLGSLASRCRTCVNEIRRDRLEFIEGRVRRRKIVQPEDTAFRICLKCRISKPIEEFYTRGHLTYCRACHSETRKARLAAMPDYNKRASVKRFYGISLEEKEAIFAAQGRKCAICGTTGPKDSRWNIDHDHACCPESVTCGKCIRGILCQNCNNGLGCAKDSVDILQKMIAYLERRMVKKAAA